MDNEKQSFFSTIAFYFAAGTLATCLVKGRKICSSTRIVKAVSSSVTLPPRECIRYLSSRKCKPFKHFDCSIIATCLIQQRLDKLVSCCLSNICVILMSLPYSALATIIKAPILDIDLCFVCSALRHKSSTIISNKTPNWSFTYRRNIAAQRLPNWSTITGNACFRSLSRQELTLIVLFFPDTTAVDWLVG